MASFRCYATMISQQVSSSYSKKPIHRDAGLRSPSVRLCLGVVGGRCNYRPALLMDMPMLSQLAAFTDLMREARSS